MKQTKPQSRRQFLKKTAVVGLTYPVISLAQNGSSVNEQLTVGLIGMGRLARVYLGTFLGRARVLAVCDVDTTRRNHALQRVNEHYGNQDCRAYADYRELLNRDDIDVVVVATPDHWHATITIAAAKAGKDIYCEKPLTHDIDEAVRVMAVIKESGVILQTGSQQRSMREFRLAAELIRNEIAGKVLSITSNFWGPGRPCDLGEEPMEPGLNWERWCGPAPLRPYHSTLSPRGVHDHWPMWRAYSEYGGGESVTWARTTWILFSGP